MALIDAQGLFRFFHAGDEETVALADVSIAVDRGEVVAVTGPSGSGKSTLLACLAGLDDPDGGMVTIAGHLMSRQPEVARAAIRSEHVGVLWQAGNLLDHLCVRDNVLLAQRLSKRLGAKRSRGAERGEPNRDADELLDQFGLADRAGAWPITLSGGESARAGLATALANQPSLLLADEPTGELDMVTAASVMKTLRTYADDGHAVIIVTHSDVVAATADRMLRLRDGRIAS